MERRDATRLPAQIPIEFVVLGEQPQRLNGRIRDISEGGLKLETEIALKPGAFIKIEFEDSAMYGELKYTCRWMNSFLSGVYIEQVLVGKSELSRLIALTLKDLTQKAPARSYASK